MRKKVWIFNHYAAEMLINEGGRHYWFAKYLKKSGYEPVVFTCNVMHFNGGNYYNSDNLWHEHSAPDGFPFVMIRSTPYQGNGKSRVKNMLVFAKNLAITAKQYAKKYGKPDIIYASSAHPFTVLVGEQLAKQMRIPCICEVRDLWPESIFAYYPEKKNKLLAKVLYAGERWMYSRANMLLFTMPGGKDYIIEKGWHEKRFFRVDEKKIYHINNGVDLDVFNQNVIRNTLHDADLDDNTYCRFIYTGSIRRANNMGLVLDAAKLLKNERVKFLIWGTGDEEELLKERCIEEKINNVVFKGSIEKNLVPSVLSQGDINFFVLEETSIVKYGPSLNKSFEYLASDKPLFIVGDVAYSMIDAYQCGVHVKSFCANAFVDGVKNILSLSIEEYRQMCRNAAVAAKEFDFTRHTQELIKAFEGLTQ